MIRTALALSLALGLLACGGGETSTAEQKVDDDRSADPPQPVLPEAQLYDDEGLLLESDDVVAGLRLPRGLEHAHTLDRRHIYYSKLPPKDLLRYFGARVITGQVTQLGEGAVYRAGVPRGVRGGEVKMDVAIRPTKEGAQVEIFEIPPPPLNPPSPTELSRQLEKMMQR